MDYHGQDGAGESDADVPEQRARIERYHELVDRDFLRSDLTADERAEMETLGEAIDRFYHSFYERIAAKARNQESA